MDKTLLRHCLLADLAQESPIRVDPDPAAPLRSENDFGLFSTAPRCLQCGFPIGAHTESCNTFDAVRQRALRARKDNASA